MEIIMFDVNFESEDPQVLSHPQYQDKVPYLLEKLKPFDLKNHFILFSSGTTGGDLKGYAVSKKALFANAKAVNDHFNLSPEDVSGLSLPVYHIGGLSVLARAYLLGNKVVDARSWNPETWSQKMDDVAITTIVPTQLYDLVKRRISPSKKLKYLIVGGDLLSSGLKAEAINLGWPVIRTFGMSEVCSQLGSAKSPESDTLEILPIHKIKIKDERLLVKSEALFTLEFIIGKEFTVKMAHELCDEEGYYITKDRASFDDGVFKHLGRIGDEFKIAGHLVNLPELKNSLSNFLLENDLYGQMEITIEDDDRKGKKLVILALSEPGYHRDEISRALLPAKIDEWRIVSSFERTALGKLKRT